jgi:serine/threonine protein kinase
VQEVLGHGGMGIVYKASHLRLRRPVAVKMLLAGPYAQPQELKRFLREAETIAGLRHPNIVQVYDGGSTTAGRTSPWSSSKAEVSSGSWQASLRRLAGRQRW